MATTTATTTANAETTERGRDRSDDDATTSLIFSDRGCCFCFPCFRSSGRSTPAVGSGSGWWERVRTVEIEDRWWGRGWRAVMKAREWSEIAAGPRWKTFLRRFGKKGGSGRHGKFQYDPLSYALNFDEGHGQNGNSEAEYGVLDFSTRFVPGKPSVDFRKGAPDFS